MESFKGKFLMRRAKNGPIIVCGVATMPEGEVEKICDADEMWVMECLVSDVIKFKPHPGSTGNYSPEDFLVNHNAIMHPMSWVREGYTPEQMREKYGR